MAVSHETGGVCRCRLSRSPSIVRHPDWPYRARHSRPRWPRELRIESEALIERIDEMARKLPDVVNGIRVQAKKQGSNHAIIEHLAAALIDRAGECRLLMEKT